MLRRLSHLCSAAAGLLLATAIAAHAQVDKDRVLILVVDGLRPDYITAEVMPRLDSLAKGGVRGLRHHAVFPTVTRVNGPSIFTGRYPGGHGLLGNTVYVPEVDPTRTLSAADVSDLRSIEAAFGGRLLTAPSLGELLEDAGKVFFAASSGSAGSAMLMNHTGAGAGLVHHRITVPDTLEPLADRILGSVPDVSGGSHEVALVARAVDAVLRIGVDRADADVLAAWLTEPDGTAHEHGVGSPRTMEVLGLVDAQIGRLLDGLEQRGVLARTNILVISDHGFSTRIGTRSVEEALVAAGLKASTNSTDVVVAGDAIHVRDGGSEKIERIVRVLQQTEWIGPVFTRAREAGSELGWVPGTLSFAVPAWDHERAADILTSGGWSDAPSEWGWPGSAFTPGVAGHGTSSPWDVRAAFVAAGPAFRHGVTTEVPTGNIDITPTTLHLVGAEARGRFDGRVLRELLHDGPAIEQVRVESDPVTAEVTHRTGSYRVTAIRSSVGGTTYFGGTRVERSPAHAFVPGTTPLRFIAHRGGIVTGYPENTLAAYRHSIALGVEAIEIDLRGTRDGHVIVMHDETVDRTTDGSGRVEDLTLAQLRALDAGDGQRVPTYEEVLELASRSGVSLLLDIKENSTLRKPEVIRLTEKYGASSRIVVGVRTLQDLREFRSLDPDLRALGFVRTVEEIPAFVAEGVDIIRLWPEWIAEDPGIVARVHGLGVPVWVTAGQAPLAELKGLAELGVDGVLSDLPELKSGL